MESYQLAKMPPPVPPKYRKLTVSSPSTAYQNENMLENGFERAATGGALIQTSGMRVKIRINPENPVAPEDRTELGSTNIGHQSNGAHVKIKVNGDVALNCSDTVGIAKVTSSACSPLLTDNLLNAFTSAADTSSKASPSRYLNGAGYQQHCGSGQSSPSDNLDSGTCSDVDAGTPPPPPYSSPVAAVGKGGHQFGVAHQRSASLNSSGIGVDSDADDEVDNVSCDSIDSSEYNADNEHTLPIISAAILKCSVRNAMPPSPATPSLPIPNGKKFESRYVVYSNEQNLVPKVAALKLTNGSSKRSWKRNGGVRFEEECHEDSNGIDDDNTDRFLHFHLNENRFDELQEGTGTSEDDSFAGLKSLIEKSTPAATIRSAKGTVRGVKNRVRAGIATFLNTTSTKSWQEKEVGKVVVYTTTMGIVRETYHRCLKVRQILRTHLIKFEEKDVFMSREVQKEIRERMNADEITVPQVFVEGIHVGDAETIDRLNESGELRQILKPYKSADALSTCQVCGGYRLLPCNLCNGSKKSIHRNHFTTELVTLKCMNCDEVGLIRCYAC